MKVEEGEGGIGIGDSNSTIEGSISNKMTHVDFASLSIRRPRISNKGDVSEVSEEALQGEYQRVPYS